MRVSDEQRRHAEQRIRAAAGALLRGEIPPGGKCDITTLAQQAGISRAALYRSYPHLKAEFEQQLARQRASGQAPDPRDSQITRLKTENAELRQRILQKDTGLSDLQQFKTLATSRLAAQHEEICRLREAAAGHQAPTSGTSRAGDPHQPAQAEPRTRSATPATQGDTSQ